MTLVLYVLIAWVLLSGALTAVVAACMAREHLRAGRQRVTAIPGDDLPQPHPAPTERERPTQSAF